MERTLKITKWGNSQGVRLPKGALNLLSLNIGDELSIGIMNGKIILSPVKNEFKFSDLFSNYIGETKQKEYWNDSPTGKENI